jgi:antitoxin HigA-1
MNNQIAEPLAVEDVLARTLARAIENSGRPKRDIASETGFHKDALLRVIRGTRSVTVDEALRLFEAAGVPARGTLFLALAGKEELAANWMHHEMGKFWDELVSSMPGTLNDALQDKFNEVRPRWAVGTSRLVARLVSEHIDDIASRDLSLALGR